MKSLLFCRLFHSTNIKYSLLLILFLFVEPLIYGQTDAGNIPWTKLGIVLDVGNPGNWDDAGVGSPCVLSFNDTLHMWYTGSDGNNYRIGHATSVDGISWVRDIENNPVLSFGNPGEWDDYWVYLPTVVRVNDVFHIWYTGGDGNDHFAIGHATSPDGVIWTKDSLNPIITKGYTWESQWVSSSFVTHEDTIFHMWYEGNSGISDIVSIGHATATNPDGKNWTKDTLNNPVLSPESGKWDYPRIEAPNLAVCNNAFYLFYSGGTYTHQQIGYATSADMINWTKNPEPCLLRGNSGEWDGWSVGTPFVCFVNNEYKLWYTGWVNSTQAKIGLATAPTLLPVEMTSFTAMSQFGNVILNWTTATEVNNQGFEIERKIILNGNEGDWVRIAFVKGHGTTIKQNEYSYSDDISTVQATSLVYRLKQMDFSGIFEYSNEVLVENPAPLDFILYPNYPNPFNPSTTISFGIPIKSNVTLKIFNIVGEEIARLCDEEKEAGRYSFDFFASGISSGVYFYQLTAGGFVQAGRMILIR